MDDAQGTSRPAVAANYTITFKPDGRVAARLDCNRATGTWKASSTGADGGSLSLGPLAMTRAFCPPPSIGDLLAKELGYVRSYRMVEGKLAMALMADAGIIVWEPIRTP